MVSLCSNHSGSASEWFCRKGAIQIFCYITFDCNTLPYQVGFEYLAMCSRLTLLCINWWRYRSWISDCTIYIFSACLWWDNVMDSFSIFNLSFPLSWIICECCMVEKWTVKFRAKLECLVWSFLAPNVSLGCVICISILFSINIWFKCYFFIYLSMSLLTGFLCFVL